ncbi:MAG: hypothetical protein ABSA84_00845 [Gammaproteobacteria bacterium]|jgi:hypothetical protein
MLNLNILLQKIRNHFIEKKTISITTEEATFSKDLNNSITRALNFLLFILTNKPGVIQVLDNLTKNPDFWEAVHVNNFIVKHLEKIMPALRIDYDDMVNLSTMLSVVTTLSFYVVKLNEGVTDLQAEAFRNDIKFIFEYLRSQKIYDQPSSSSLSFCCPQHFIQVAYTIATTEKKLAKLSVTTLTTNEFDIKQQERLAELEKNFFIQIGIILTTQNDTSSLARDLLLRAHIIKKEAEKLVLFRFASITKNSSTVGCQRTDSYNSLNDSYSTQMISGNENNDSSDQESNFFGKTVCLY